jgi:hypothetical protein
MAAHFLPWMAIAQPGLNTNAFITAARYQGAEYHTTNAQRPGYGMEPHKTARLVEGPALGYQLE